MYNNSTNVQIPTFHVRSQSYDSELQRQFAKIYIAINSMARF
jgi:dimeric dUTPase (all-alpha-NTP-PPase superfamily)